MAKLTQEAMPSHHTLAAHECLSSTEEILEGPTMDRGVSSIACLRGHTVEMWPRLSSCCESLDLPAAGVISLRGSRWQRGFGHHVNTDIPSGSPVQK